VTIKNYNRMNKSIIKKYTAILALTLSAMLFLPTMSFGKGAVIGYAPGYKPVPNTAQLDRLTHVMVFQLFPNTSGDGSLYTKELPSWNLSDFIKFNFFTIP